MNNYLLLRDNKQSGPYSVEELVSKGLKAYDLVWQEGKSAAWRYPSEVEELKPFAPAVEEQPFDRFFKKPALEETSLITEKKTEAKPVTATPPATEFLSADIKDNSDTGTRTGKKEKSIYITFPAVTGSSAVSKAANITGSSSFFSSIADTPAKHDLAITGDEKKKYAPQATEVSPVPEDTAVTINNDIRKQPSFPENPPSRLTASNEKIILKWVVAACFLLAGVVIGMLVTYNSQKKNVRQLNNLVEQIEKRNRDLSANMYTNSANLMPADIVADTSSVAGQSGENIIPVNDDLATQQKPASDNKTKHVQKMKVDTTAAVIKTPLGNRESEKIDPAAAVTVRVNTHDTEAPRNPSPKDLLSLVKIENNKYKTGLLGGISNLQLLLTNKSSYQLENVEVEIHYLSPEKRVVKTQTVSFANIAPGAKVSLDVPKSNRGVSVNYLIKKINSRGPGIARSGL